MENLILKSSGWWVGPWNRTVVGGLPATKVEVERGGIACAIAANKLSKEEREILGILPWQEYGVAKFHDVLDWEVVEEAGIKIRRPVHVEFKVGEAKADLMAKIDGKRKVVEEGGFVFDEVFYATDQKGRTALESAQAAFDLDINHVETDWLARAPETNERVWVSIDSAKYAALMVSMRDHIRACFTEQRRKSEELVPSINTYDDYLYFIEFELDSSWQ